MSPHVLPPPRDRPCDVVACGYWWPGAAAAGARLDPATEAFLAAGPPPVFLGLGSTPVRDAAATTRGT